MKKLSITVLLLALPLFMTFTACKNGTDTSVDALDLIILDISQETDWDYTAIGKDGSSIFFDVNKSNDIPTKLYLKPKKNSDDGFTFLLKDNGLPDKMITKNHILLFENYNDYKFDVAIIYPNNTIEYFYGIETDINFGNYRAVSISDNERSILSGLSKIASAVSHAIGIGTCLVSPIFPAAAVGCATYVGGNIIKAASNNVHVDLTVDVASTIIDVIGCAGGGVSGAISCISGLAGSVSLLSNLDLNLTNQKAQQLTQASGTINNNSTGSYTVTYNINYGVGTTPLANLVKSGSSITLPSGSGLSRTGYTFGGWNTNAAGTGTTYPAGSSFKPTASVTLYAKWDITGNQGGSGSDPFIGTWTGKYTNGSSVVLEFSSVTGWKISYGNGTWQQGSYTYSGNTATLYFYGDNVGSATISGYNLTLKYQNWDTFTLSKGSSGGTNPGDSNPGNSGSNPFIGTWSGYSGNGQYTNSVIIMEFSDSGFTLTYESETGWRVVQGTYTYNLYSGYAYSYSATLYTDGLTFFGTGGIGSVSDKSVPFLYFNIDGWRDSIGIYKGTLPSAPTGLTVTVISNDLHRLNWNTVPGALGYVVISDKGSITCAGPPFDADRFTNGDGYNMGRYYSVRARNSTGYGPASAVVAAW